MISLAVADGRAVGAIAAAVDFWVIVIILLRYLSGGTAPNGLITARLWA